MKQPSLPDRLLAAHPIMSDQIGRPALQVVLRELEGVLEQGITGDLAEFGCYSGTTSLFIRRVLDAHDSERQFYAYDSFQGLPVKGTADNSRAGEQFLAGALAVSKKDFLRNFQRAGLRPPITYKAWFSDLQAEQLPDRLAYAFVDGDFYQSILESLKLSWPRLSPGGVLTIDDYGREALPGVERAVHDYFGDTPATLRVEHNIAIIRKT
jgi:O-methyltransferase